jgi:flagellar hook protein FlgE
MINAIQIALSGLTGATRKVDASAQNIAANGADADLAAEAVNLSMAKTEYKANAKVIETAQEMDDALLHLFDEKV